MAKELFVMLTVGCGIFFLFLFTAVEIDKSSCRQFAEKNQVEWYYKFPVGCLIYVNDDWVSPEAFLTVKERK